MAELIASTALEGRAPFEAGAAWLGEKSVGAITSVAPLRGQEEAVHAALAQSLGLGYPGPGRVLEAEGARIAWAGHAQVFLLGAEPPASLEGIAALTDLSDGWVALRLHGAGAGDVLARLVPVDLRAGSFGAGASARTLLGHIPALILGREDGFEVLIMRSFALSAWEEIETAMRGLAARE